MKTDYDQQAETFLTTHGLRFRATLADSKPATWGADANDYHPHYRVTISGAQRRLTFDFWGSVNDGRTGRRITPYDVLACISCDAHTPTTFADFCAEYGYDDDSRKVEQLFRRCDRFAKRLRAFFTADEINALSEIR